MSIGRRFHETQDLDLPTVAQRMRADVAELKTDGQMPAHAVVSVRVDQKGAGTGSIEISVSGLRDAEVWCTPGVTEEHTRDGHWGGLTPIGRRINDALEEIHRAYNYDKSDSMTDYFDVRYYGSVTIRDEETQRWYAKQKACQQERAAANRAARQAADTLPLRATIVGDRSPRLVIADTTTGHVVATVDASHYSRELLTVSYVGYLLDAHGWEAVRYHRRSKANPTAYWSVRRAVNSNPIPTPVVEPVTEKGEQAPAAPAPGPLAEAAPPARTVQRQRGTSDQADGEGQADEYGATGPVKLDPADWSDLDPDHWAAHWVRNTHEMPEDDPARIWSQANAVLIAADYRHERREAPGSVDHTAQVVTTDARGNVADEAAELSRHATAVLAHRGAAIRSTYPHARPIVLDGSGLSGTRCETRCGALARWSVPHHASVAGAPSRLGYCSACLLAHAHPVTQVSAASPESVVPTDVAQPAKAVVVPDGEPVEPGEADNQAEFDGVTILHTAETGTLLLDDTQTPRPCDPFEVLAAAEQRWRLLPHDHDVLYLPYTRDRAARRYDINRAAELLRAAGAVVRISIDDTPRDPAEVAADRQDRSAERVAELRARGGRRLAASDAALNRSNQISERFAGGQPILNHHHSAPRARRDRARSDAAMDRSWELRRAAERDLAAADAAERHTSRRHCPQAIGRRIARNTAEEARIQRGLAGYQRRFRYPSGYRVEEHPAATGTYREQLLGQLQHVRAALAADRQALEDLQAAGAWCPVDPGTIKPGDAIRARGRWEKVTRVNRSTVSVATGYSWTDRVPFAEITGHRPASTG